MTMQTFQVSGKHVLFDCLMDVFYVPNLFLSRSIYVSSEIDAHLSTYHPWRLPPLPSISNASSSAPGATLTVLGTLPLYYNYRV